MSAASDPRTDGERIATPVPEPTRVPIGTLDFLRAAEEVMGRLTELTGLSTWLVTRNVGDDSIVLAVRDATYGLTPGADLRAFPELLLLVAAESQSGILPSVVPFDDPSSIDLRDNAVGCLVALPIEIGRRKPFGMVYGVHPTPHPEPDALRALQPVFGLAVHLLGTVLALDLDRSRLQRKVDVAENVALSDELTGLGNRRSFERAVTNEQARCERFGHLAAIMMVDLDDLKVVNDRDGHAAGDELLRRTAEVLRTSVRDADQAFRVGGDEFALLLPEVSPDDLTSLLERVHEALDEAELSASVGGAIRRTGEDLRNVVADADAAMYLEKEQRRQQR